MEVTTVSMEDTNSCLKNLFPRNMSAAPKTDIGLGVVDLEVIRAHTWRKAMRSTLEDGGSNAQGIIGKC